jgi:hypothetical protein
MTDAESRGNSAVNRRRAFEWILWPLLALLGIFVLPSAIVAWNTLPRIAPTTRLHYAPNHNFGPGGRFLPGELGFNLADLNTVSQLDSLPPGVQGLVWVGQCDGVTPAFLQTVRAFIGHAKLFGFYLMDNPDPRARLTRSGYVPACAPEHLRTESDWIHTNLPGAKTFMILMNLGTAKKPWFSTRYAPTIIHVDLYGIDPYPCRTELRGCAYDMIDRYIGQAEAIGIPRSQMVPVYQAFGDGNYTDDFGGKYILPTAAEERRIMLRWGMMLPTPVFDYAYSWGVQERDRSLEGAWDLHPIFATHNMAEPSIGMTLSRLAGDGSMAGQL